MKRYLLALTCLVLLITGATGQTVLLSQNFANGISNGWRSVDNSGDNAGKWTYNHNPITLTNYLPETFNSTTAANGFAAIISDGNAKALNTDLISPAINCSASTFVALQFEYVMGLVTPYPTAQVFVSNDSANWYLVYDALNSATGANPQLAQVDISAYAALEPTVYVKFNYQATANVLWAVDDISVVNLPNDGAGLDSIVGGNYTAISNHYPVQCTVENLGGPLNSVTLSYSIDGGTPVTENFNSFNLSSFQTQNLQFTTPAPILTAGPHTITIVSSAPNGDVTSPNDTISRTISFFTHITTKNVFIEEFATAVCGFCPGGALYLQDVLNAEGSYVIAATHHAGYMTDAMTLGGDQTLATAFTPPGGGAPEAAIDRVLFSGEGGIAIGVPNLLYIDEYNPWDSLVEAEKPVFPPLSISASNTYNDTTRLLNVTVNATVYGVISGDFRVNCYVVEDSVVTDETGYQQVCYYCEGAPEAISNTAINPYYNECTYNSGTQEYYVNGYVDNHVVRYYMGGTWGTSGVIPATTTTDSTYTTQYATYLSNGWRANHVSLVAFVSNYNADYTSGINDVLNVVSMPLNGSAINDTAPAILAGVTEIPHTVNSVSLYPNPANDYAYLRYSLNEDTRISFAVYNSLGQTVYVSPETNVSKGAATSYINTEKYASGLYLVAVKQQGNLMQTLKFVINR